MNSAAVDSATETFVTSFCERNSRTRLPITLLPDEPRELLPGTVYEFDIDHEQYGLCLARMYAGLSNKVAGQLWAQETQALLRLSSRRHAALPRVCETEFRDEDSVGIVISDCPGRRLSALDMETHRRDDPAGIVRLLHLAADGLRTLHATGLIHRDIWRESFFLWDPLDGRPTQLRLTGFEMSAFAASLADPKRLIDSEERYLWRAYRDRGGLARRICRAPEIVDTEEEITVGGMSPRTDIYALGMVAYQWFVGEIPEQPARSGAEAGTEYSMYVDTELARTTALSSRLRSLLRSMIKPKPANRPTASDVVNELAIIADESATVGDGPEEPYVLAIVPSMLTRYANIEEWKPYPPDEGTLLSHFRSLIQNDLADAAFVHHPPGAAPYVERAPAQQAAESKWVLLGRRAAYFCHPFVAGQGVRSTTLDSVMHVDYILDRNRVLDEVGSAPLRRRIGRVKVVHYANAPDVQPERAKRMKNPSWKPVRDAVVSSSAIFEGEGEFRKGINWWLQIHRAGTNNKNYAYKRSTIPSTRTPAGNELVRLVVDRKRDDDWIESDPMRFVLGRMVRRPRPAFGDFFGTLGDRDHSGEVSWVADFKNRPERDGIANRGSGTVKRKTQYEVEVEVMAGTSPPEIGWLYPADIGAEEKLLFRQIEASAALFERPALMQSLCEPQSHMDRRETWMTSADSNLRGNSEEVIAEMLRYAPFYALQGPPGTGKTTAVVHAICRLLKHRPSSRVLVSAQSHFALDELAQRIVKEAGIDEKSDLIALRAETSRKTPMKAFFDSALATARLDAIKSAHENYPAPLQSLVADWKRTAKLWELQERIWRSANVVFATTGTCTEEYVGSERFDWVIVEEAAKAWCAELAMPLVRGERWTLIGDHKQLPPFGENEIHEIYEACRASQLQHVRDLTSESDVFKATLDIFGTLFRHAVDNPRVALPSIGEEEGSRLSRRFGRWPLNQLDMQFRMDDRILRIIKNTFYRTEKLESDPRLCGEGTLHGFDTPTEVAGRAALWLDTSDYPPCSRETEYWANEGEVDVVRAFISQLPPGHSKSLAILSPYRKQNELLRQALPDEAESVHTVDSFQGREADIVIVSLVRTNPCSVEEPRRRIGHLESAHRSNVLLSRAKELLVIVGDFVHFGSTITTCWESICKSFQEARCVVKLKAGK